MRTKTMLTALLAQAAVMAAPMPAQTARLRDLNGFNVALGCHMQNVKVLVITNTTGAVIPAGTVISYDAVRAGDGSHYGRSVSGGALAPGASFKRGGEPSTSCTAWFRRLPVLAPVN